MRHRAAPCLAALLTFAACHAAPAATPVTGQVEHIVLVWLKDGTTADKQAAKANLIATARTFPREIPGIVSLHVGDALPGEALAAGPDAPDPFDLAFVMRFASEQALDAYQGHPVHTRALAEVLAPAARRVVVHDALLR